MKRLSDWSLRYHATSSSHTMRFRESNFPGYHWKAYLDLIDRNVSTFFYINYIFSGNVAFIYKTLLWWQKVLGELLRKWKDIFILTNIVKQTITFEQNKLNKMAVFSLGYLKVWDFYARTAFRRPPLDHPLWRKGPGGAPLSSYPSNLLRFFFILQEEVDGIINMKLKDRPNRRKALEFRSHKNSWVPGLLDL